MKNIDYIEDKHRLRKRLGSKGFREIKQPEANRIKIQIKKHNVVPNQKVIEISEGNNLIATIIPRTTNISIVSKYIEDVESDLTFPPKITINLKERK